MTELDEAVQSVYTKLMVSLARKERRYRDPIKHKPFEMTNLQKFLLGSLCNEPITNLKAFADANGLNKSTIGYALKSLDVQRMVVKDARGKRHRGQHNPARYTITDKGREALEGAR